jgi:hypothetical protein
MIFKSLNRGSFPLFNLIKHPSRVTSIARVFWLWFKTYFAAQKKTKTENATIIETSLDDRIAPDEQAIYPYLFACLYILYVVWVLLDQISHKNYQHAHKAFKELILEAEEIFLEFPTRMSNRNRIFHPLTRFVQTIDGPTNCFPSLHVALITLSYFIMDHEAKTETLLHSALRKSCIDICRSTMKTKQHSMIDVIGGLVITERKFEKYFQTVPEDILGEILPELTDAERTQIRKICKETPDFPILMQELLSQFKTGSITTLQSS